MPSIASNVRSETSIPNVSVNTGDLNISSTTNNPLFEITLNEIPKNQNDPKQLFGKACTEWNHWRLTDSETYYDQNPPTTDFDVDYDVTSQYCDITLFADNLRIGNIFNYFFPVVVDIDNPDDYYVKLDCSFTSGARVGQVDIQFRYNDGASERKDSSKYIESSIRLDMLNVPQLAYSGNNGEFERVELFGANNQAVYTFSNESTPQSTTTTTHSLITKNCSIYLGQKIIPFKMYGLKVRRVQENDGGLAIPTVTVNNDEGNREFYFEITEYWPYKNADGQPVWNTSTGTLVNSPLP